MGLAIRLCVPAGVFVLLVAAGIGDHYFRDEFYYLACSDRLAWGYVDHPPLSVAILWGVRQFAGSSLLTLRVTAAAVAALSVWLTGSVAQRLGASAFGQTLAMVGCAVAPQLLAVGSFFSMNVFELLLWTLSVRLLIAVLDRPTSIRWVMLGLTLGLGLQNKISVLWLGAGIAAGLLLTPARRLLLTRGPWLAGAIAALVFLPHVVWQWTHGWPTLEFIANASRDKMQSTTPLAFAAAQVLTMGPLTLPIWLGGLGYLLFAPKVARYRALGIVFIVVAAIVMLNSTSRASYLAPAYPMLLAAGGAAGERLLRRRSWQIGALAVLLVSGAVTAPLALPLLSADHYVAYSRALGLAPGTEEKHDIGRLPQFFADRQGWDQLVDQVADAWARLTPDERRHAAVLAGNYGEAGAIEHLGRSRGLLAISGHNNFWLWGPGDARGDVMIVLSTSLERQQQRYESVERVGRVDCGDCMPYENEQQIFICRRPKVPLQTAWPNFKHYD